jgi:hypothetical protein
MSRMSRKQAGYTFAIGLVLVGIGCVLLTWYVPDPAAPAGSLPGGVELLQGNWGLIAHDYALWLGVVITSVGTIIGFQSALDETDPTSERRCGRSSEGTP